MTSEAQLSNLMMLFRGAWRYAKLRLSDPKRLSDIASREAPLLDLTRDIMLLRNKVRVMKGRPPSRRTRAVIRTMNSLARKLRNRGSISYASGSPAVNNLRFNHLTMPRA